MTDPIIRQFRENGIAAPKPKSSAWDWLFWWRISPEELERQATEYYSLKALHSMRGLSAALLMFSATITCCVAFFGVAGATATAYVDASLMAVLAGFTFAGCRWAMISAMGLWSLEKLLYLLDQTNASGAWPQIIGWTLLMHALYFAFRVEQRRRALA